MKTKFLFCLLFLLSGCGSPYNIDLPPPDPTQRVEAVFPEKINGMDRVVAPVDVSPLRGYEAGYGQGQIGIRVLQAQNPAAADDFFKNQVAPSFDVMPSHTRGQFNGKWTASGTDKDKRVWYAWVNQNWIFVLNAADQKMFDLIPGNFAYIIKK